jgi:aldehyde:ferredoxin oxidoreductase
MHGSKCGIDDIESSSIVTTYAIGMGLTHVEGVTRKDDALSGRLLNVPLPEGPPKGQVVELDEMSTNK